MIRTCLDFVDGFRSVSRCGSRRVGGRWGRASKRIGPSASGALPSKHQAASRSLGSRSISAGLR